MCSRYDEEECQVFNFVKSCLGEERARNWESISKEDAVDITKMATAEVLKAFFQPENNPKLVEKYGKDISMLKLIEEHKECSFDAFLYNRLLNFTRYESTKDLDSIQQFFKEKENDFFNTSNAVPQSGLRPLKCAKNYAAKIYTMLSSEKQTVFFELKANAFGCYFYTPFLENVFFPLEKMNLIPSFVRWRNAHLIQWFLEAVKTKKNRAYKKFEKQLLLDELYDANRELQRSFYEEYEDRIRRIFEMRMEFKVLLIQHTVDFSPNSLDCLKQIILIRYQDYRSALKPEIECSISIENFDEEFNEFKKRISSEDKYEC